MSVDHNIIQSLRIVGRDGTDKTGTMGSRVKLTAGNGFSLDQDTTEQRSTIINADMSIGQDDPFFQKKFYDMINGGFGGSGTTGPYRAYAFTRNVDTDGGLYAATINGKGPYKPDGAIALVGSACGQVGEFPDVTMGSTGPIDATVEENPNQMSVFDMCPADVDCEDYYKLFSRMKIINDFIETNRDKNLTTDMELFKQYEALVEEWNYLANMQGIIFKVYASDQYIRVISGYRMLGCDQPPLYGPMSGVFWLVDTQLISGQTDIMVTPKTTGTDFSKAVLKPKITTSTGTNFIVTVGGDMYKKDFVVVMSVFAVNKIPDSLSSSSSSGSEPGPVLYNDFQVTGTFFNTHLGVPVTQVKRLETRYV